MSGDTAIRFSMSFSWRGLTFFRRRCRPFRRPCRPFRHRCWSQARSIIHQPGLRLHPMSNLQSESMTDDVKSEDLAYRNDLEVIEEGLLRKRQRLRSTKARYAAALLMAFVSAGCTSVKPTYTQTGLAGYTINCPGDSHENCYAKAGELCGERGYEVFQQSAGARFNIVITCKAPRVAEEPVTIPLVIPQSNQ